MSKSKPAARGKTERPTSGGSYVRTKTGKLSLAESTKPAEARSSTAPAIPPHSPVDAAGDEKKEA